MLESALLRSPHARARVQRIDLAAAAAAPGVLAVVGPGEVWGIDEDVYFEGGAVAGVAAETLAQARAAVELIEIEWEELEPLLDADEAVERGSLIQESRRYERGDYERGLAEAEAVVEAEYTTQTLNHNPLETHQCVCEWRGDSLDVYVSTQYIWGLRRDLAENLGLPQDKVRVICEFMGGGFGAKNGIGNYLVLAAELAKRTGRPVRCALSRREENVVGGNRNATRQRVTAAARADGTLTALGGEYTCALGWEGWLPPTAGPTQLLYACENVRTVEHGAKLNIPPMAAFRAPGFVEGTWSLECLLDKLAAQLGDRPARAAEAQLRARRRDGRPPLLVEEPDGVLPPRRAALGAAAGGARALGRGLEARHGDGEPDLVRRRRPAQLRLGAARLRRPRERRHGDAGHRHRHPHGDGDDRGGGARPAARPRRGADRRLGPRPVRVDLRRLVDAALDGPGRALGRGRRRAPGGRAGSAALRSRGAHAVAEGRAA